MSGAWAQAFALVFEPYNLWVMLAASLYGLFVGAVPGLTATMAIASGSELPATCCGQNALNAPSSAMNSPVKPLVVGRPIEARRTIMKSIA